MNDDGTNSWGSSPIVAIKYQIVLMITVFSSAIKSVIITILISDRFVFDDMDNLRNVRR